MPDTRLDIAIRQLEFARSYTLSLLADIDDDDWFRQPREGVTHVAWQVGHLAMAQYGLGLFRMRGRRLEDADLMSGPFRKKFSKSSLPDPRPENNPTPAEIRGVFQQVHQQVMSELPRYNDAQVDEPVEEPYALFATKLGSLYFCAAHEMMHAGQIGLLRRLLGKATTR